MRQTVYFLLLVLGLSCSKPDGLEPTLKKYTVQQGKNDFTPNPTLLPGEARTIEGAARFHASCWYDNLGVDNYDFNKLIGVYRYWDLKKNHNSFILGWRPDIKIRDVFELVLYENISGRNVPHESVIYKVKQDELFRFRLEEVNGWYSLYINDVLQGVQQNDVQYKTIGLVGTYFGGNKTAPHTMWLYLIF